MSDDHLPVLTRQLAAECYELRLRLAESERLIAELRATIARQEAVIERWKDLAWEGDEHPLGVPVRTLPGWAVDAEKVWSAKREQGANE